MTNKGVLIEEAYDVTPICEEVGDKKTWFIRGVFMQSDVVNRNRRIYSEKVLDDAAKTYTDEYLQANRAIGELNHPDTLSIDLERICHRIVSLEKQGKDYYGKARVLNTPCGRALQGLLEGGVKIGVSTRGCGTTKRNSVGVTSVMPGYKIVAIDTVFHPSAPDAFTDALMEGADWVWDQKDDDVIFVESIRDEIKVANKRRLTEAKLETFSKFVNMLKG